MLVVRPWGNKPHAGKTSQSQQKWEKMRQREMEKWRKGVTRPAARVLLSQPRSRVSHTMGHEVRPVYCFGARHLFCAARVFTRTFWAKTVSGSMGHSQVCLGMRCDTSGGRLFHSCRGVAPTFPWEGCHGNRVSFL